MELFFYQFEKIILILTFDRKITPQLSNIVFSDKMKI